MWSSSEEVIWQLQQREEAEHNESEVACVDLRKQKDFEQLRSCCPNHRQQMILKALMRLRSLNEFQKNVTFPEEGSEGCLIPQWEIFPSLFSMVSYSTKLF